MEELSMYSAESQHMFKILRLLYQPIYFRNRIKLRINPPKIKTIGRINKYPGPEGQACPALRELWVTPGRGLVAKTDKCEVTKIKTHCKASHY